MIDDDYFKKTISLAIIAALVVLSFLLLKPILGSIIAGILLAFIFSPIQSKLNKKFKNKNIGATLICSILLVLIIIPLWFLTPVLLDQSIEIFVISQQIDFVSPLQTAFPSLFATEEISLEIGRVIHSFVTKITNGTMNLISQLLLNFPTLLLHLTVALFTFFFVLRDNEEFINYIKSLLPFPKSIQKKLFKSSKDITSSILYGQIVIGILQGLFAGMSFFIFGIENSLFLTIIASIAGIFPIVGTSLVWIPVAIYSFVQGDFLPAIGVAIFGLLASFFENSIKPMIISKRTNVHSGLILVGMIGGILFFGILGFILGPLILAYALIVLETFRDKTIPGIFLK